MAIVGQLEIQLLADVARLKSDMAEAKIAVKSTADDMSSALNFLKGAFSVTVVLAWTKAIIEAGEAAAATAQRVGMTVEQLGALQIAMRQTGVDASSVKTLFSGMARSVEDNAEAWTALGIATQEGGRMRPTIDLLTEAADLFKLLPDGITKTRLSMTLFNRQGAEIIPLLNEGGAGIRKLMADAEAAGAVMSGTAAEALKAFGDELTILKGRAEASSAAFLEPFIPTLIQLAKSLGDVSKQARELSLQNDLADWLRTVLGWLMRLEGASHVAIISLRAFRDIFFSPWDQAKGIWEKMKTDIAAVNAATDAAVTSIKNAKQAYEDRNKAREKQSQQDAAELAAAQAGAMMRAQEAMRIKEIEAARKAAAAAAEREAEAQRKRVEGGKEVIAHLENEVKLQNDRVANQKQVSAAEQDYLRITEDVAKGRIALNATQMLYVHQLLLQRDAIKETKDATIAYNEDIEKQREAIGAANESLQQQIDKQSAQNGSLLTGVDALGQYEVATLRAEAATKAFIAAQLSETGADLDLIRRYQDQADLLNKLADTKQRGIDIRAFKKSTDDMTEFAKQAAREIQNALGSTLEQMLAGNFENIDRMWAATIRKMIAQALAAKLNQALFGDLGTTGWGWVGQIGALLAGLGGGSPAATTGMPANPPMYAAGTDYVPRDMIAKVHEGEQIIPKGQNRPSVVLQPTFHMRFDSSTDTAKIAGMVQQGVQAGNRAMLDTLKAHGVI